VKISTTGTLKIYIKNFYKEREKYTSASSKAKECLFSPRDWALIIHWDTVPVDIIT
jgi:hypothetical protein